MNTIENHQKKNVHAFIVLLITGVAVIAVQKWILEIEPALAWIAPTLIVSIYGITTHIQEAHREGADNCYYLGFLLTLASLAFTLATFDYIILEGDTETISTTKFDDEIKEVMASFGIALATTFAGIAGRLWLRHLDKSRVSSDDQAERIIEILRNRVQTFDNVTNELTKKFQLLTAQSNQVVNRANHQLQSTGQSYDNLGSTLQNTANEIHQSGINMQHGVQQAISQIKEAAESMNHAVNNTAQGLTEATRKITDAATSMNASSETLRASASQTQESLKNIASHAQTTTSQMTSTAQSVMDTVQETGSKLKSNLDNLDNQSNRSRQNLKDLQDSSEKTLKNIQDIAQKTKETEKELKVSLDNQTSRSRQNLQDLQNSSEKTLKNMQDIEQKTKELHRSISNAPPEEREGLITRIIYGARNR